jgi:hypothetical protein
MSDSESPPIAADAAHRIAFIFASGLRLKTLASEMSIALFIFKIDLNVKSICKFAEKCSQRPIGSTPAN